jgi:hypothetical protein
MNMEQQMRSRATKLMGCMHSKDASCEDCMPLVEAFRYYYSQGKRHERTRSS